MNESVLRIGVKEFYMRASFYSFFLVRKIHFLAWKKMYPRINTLAQSLL